MKNARALVLVGLSLSVTLAAVPAQAGFLDQIFGGFQRQEPRYDPPQASQPQAPDDPVELRRYLQDYQGVPTPPRRRVVVDENPVLQKPTTVLRDPTLQPGDAVMTKDGVKVFVGDYGDRHSWNEFVPLRTAARDLPRSERATLVAIDETREGRRAAFQSGLLTGRSAATVDPVVRGREVTDARGNSVRYVGP